MKPFAPPMTPFVPLRHCPQCDGAIDARCVRVSRVSYAGTDPRRQVEAWCEFCLTAFRTAMELHAGEWQIVGHVTAIRGDLARSIRTHAETQMNVIQETSR